MKILTKQYNRQYKDRHYFWYTRRIWFGCIRLRWKFWGYTTPREAPKAVAVLEADGYVYADWK